MEEARAWGCIDVEKIESYICVYIIYIYKWPTSHDKLFSASLGVLQPSWHWFEAMRN